MSEVSYADYTDVEFLSDLAKSLTTSRIVAVEAGEDINLGLAIVNLALKLKSQPSVQFRALVEEWDRLRLVQELY